MTALPDRPAFVRGRRTESIGALLARVRAARGISQLQLAQQLCAAAGQPTVSRHEISRWEREERVPGAYWLRWLALVLEVPTDELEAAAAMARARRSLRPASPADRARRSLRPASPGGPADTADPAVPDPARLAHAWLAAPGELALRGTIRATAVGAATGCPPARALEALEALDGRISDLRRVDDLVGGADLTDTVQGELGAALRLSGVGRPTRRTLARVAELAQLAGWIAADAGRTRLAVRDYRIALAAAEAAGDRMLGAHVLGCLSHLLAPRDPAQALLIARTAYAGVPARPASLRVLLAHRIAFAAALAGERRASERALAQAERLADRRTAQREPAWLYWLDDGELAALAGRCFAALRRPLRAEPLLRPRLDRSGGCGPRTAALDGGWLAQAYLDAGELELAGATASRALVAAVRSGSARAAIRTLALTTRLTSAGPARAARRYAGLVAAARPYLPGSTVRGTPACMARPGDGTGRSGGGTGRSGGGPGRLGGGPGQRLAFPA